MNKREVGRVAAVAWGKGACGVEKGRRAGVWRAVGWERGVGVGVGTGWMGCWEGWAVVMGVKKEKTSWCGGKATGGAVGSGLVGRWDGWGPGMVGKKEGGG